MSHPLPPVTDIPEENAFYDKIDPPARAAWCDHIIMSDNRWMLYSPSPPCDANNWNFCPMCGKPKAPNWRAKPHP